jgi:energy-coupling factor transporter ATP-binding protein EcfA2
MAAIWMLPSLVLGLYLGFSTGMWQLALMSFGSALIAVVVSRVRRPGAGESSTAASPFTTVGKKILYFDKPLTRWRWMLSPKLRASARSLVAERQREQNLLLVLPRLLGRGFRASRAGELCAVLGESQGASIEVDLTTAPHVFVVGPTGSGKSQLLRILAKSLTNRYLPTELQLMLVDFKGGGLLDGLGLEPWLVANLSDLEGDRSTFWDGPHTLLQQRERDPTLITPRVLIIVDELAEVLRDQAACAALTSVAARGRSLGVHLVLANQGLSGVPRDLLLNLRLRVALAGVDQVELVQLGGKASPRTSGQHPLIGARLIQHQAPDRDFNFAVGLV